MELNAYNTVYLLSNVFFTYVIFLYFNIFFKRDKKSIKELACYIFYFLASSSVYVFINIPLVTIATNILCFVLIVSNYQGSNKNKLASIMFVFGIIMGIELVVGYTVQVVFSLTNGVDKTSQTILPLCLSRIFTFVLYIFIKNYTNIKKQAKISNIKGLGIFIIPFSTLYLMAVIMGIQSINYVIMFSSVLFLVIINIVTLYLYDGLNEAFHEINERALIGQQQKYYEQQFKLIKESHKKVRTIKHDLKNHLFVIDSYIKMNDLEKSVKYIKDIIDITENQHEYARSGNNVIDSIINFKLSEAEKKGIVCKADISIIEELDIPAFTLSVVLGNLLDNAIYATKNIKEDKWISITIRYSYSRLFITIKNSFDGKVNYKKGEIVTRKNDQENHGLGLQSVKSILEKENGELQITHENNIFVVNVLIYDNANCKFQQVNS